MEHVSSVTISGSGQHSNDPHLRLRCVASSCTRGDEAAERVRDLVSDRALFSTSMRSSPWSGNVDRVLMIDSGSADATVYLLSSASQESTQGLVLLTV